MIATIFLATTLAAADARPHAELLIEAAELQKLEMTTKFVIVDARPRAGYNAGHLPRAMWVDHDAWSKAFATDPADKEAWSKRFEQLGIDGERPVVIYDDNNAKDAARIWWIVRYWGIKDARLLNGGWKAWQTAGNKISKEELIVSRPKPTLEAQADRLATKEQLFRALDDKKLQIIDARAAAEYCGEQKTAKRAGTIPGSKPLEWIEVIDKKTQKFKSMDELNALFKQANIDPGKPTVTFCQSGGRAAVMAFALELAGGKDVRNYYRSWAEWGNADDTPVVVPKK